MSKILRWEESWYTCSWQRYRNHRQLTKSRPWSSFSQMEWAQWQHHRHTYRWHTGLGRTSRVGHSATQPEPPQLCSEHLQTYISTVHSIEYNLYLLLIKFGLNLSWEYSENFQHTRLCRHTEHHTFKKWILWIFLNCFWPYQK